MTRYQEVYAGKKVCCNCAHYFQHYGKRKRGYYIVNCGHCCYPRAKARQPDQTCGNWKAEKEPVSSC